VKLATDPANTVVPLGDVVMTGAPVVELPESLPLPPPPQAIQTNVAAISVRRTQHGTCKLLTEPSFTQSRGMDA